MYDIGDVVRCTAAITSIGGVYVDPNSLVFYIKDPTGTTTTYTYGVDPSIVKTGTGQYYIDITLSSAGQWFYRYASSEPSAAGESSFQVGDSFSAGIEISETTDLDYLMPYLRMHIGDTNESSYVYSDAFLRRALLMGFKLVQPRWNYKYLLSYSANNWSVTRNPQTTFVQATPPVIMYADERPIILGAAIAMRSGLIWTAGSDAVSWRDEEISFSNITGARMREASFMRDWDELHQILPERRSRLATPIKGELVGFKNPPNVYEGE